jgi:hypothetical protein
MRRTLIMLSTATLAILLGSAPAQAQEVTGIMTIDSASRLNALQVQVTGTITCTEGRIGYGFIRVSQQGPKRTVHDASDFVNVACNGSAQPFTATPTSGGGNITFTGGPAVVDGQLSISYPDSSCCEVNTPPISREVKLKR